MQTLAPTAICTSCDLHKLSKVNCLRGEGPQKTSLMFIGEAPGEEEEMRNRPFVGPSGEVFDRLLYTAGISRQSVFITNTAKCRPVDHANFRRDRENRIHYGNLTPTPQQSYSCASKYLEDEIKTASPKVIVAMGNVACDYIFGKYRLLPDGSLALNNKGKPMMVKRMPKITDLIYGEYWDSERGCFIVPAFHPSFVMRSMDAFLLTAELIRKAARIAEKGPGTEKTEFAIATTYDDAMAIIRRASEHRILAYDHETYGLDWRFGPLLNIGLSWKAGTGASIRMVDNHGVSIYTPDQRKAILEASKTIFQNPDKVLVGYNEPFDSSWTEKGLGIKVTTPSEDVQVMYHSLNSSATHSKQSLEALSWLYTDMHGYKEESRPWFDKKKFIECPIDVMSRRNASDCDATLRLYNRFRPKLEAHPIFKHYQNMISLLPKATTVLHINGANVDLQRLRGMRERLEEASLDLVDQFRVGAGVPETLPDAKGKPQKFNLRSTKHLAWTLFTHLKLPILERTPTGNPKTSEYILQELAKINPALNPLMEYKKLQKLLGTYVLGLRGAALFGNSKKRKPDVWTVEEARAAGYDTDGRVHPNFSAVGTVTGRPSVSRPNTANQPRPTDQQRQLGVVLRQAFAAPDGWLVLERDLSQAELRTLAAVSGDEILADAVNSPEGVHKRTAMFLYKIPLSEVDDSRKSSSKTIVFAIVYGGTSHTVEEKIPDVLDAELKRRKRAVLVAEGKFDAELDQLMDEYMPSREERLALADEWIAAWRAQYPKAGQWIDYQKAFVSKNGYVISVFGRIYYFPLALSDNYRIKAECQRQAVNYLIQGPSCEVTWAAGIRVQAEIERRGMKSRWVNMVYDALFYETPKDEVKELDLLVKTEMERPIPELPIQFTSEVEIGQCWKEDKHDEEPVEGEVEIDSEESEDDDHDEEEN